MGKDCISKSLAIESGQSAPCPDLDCTNTPRVYTAKSIAQYIIPTAPSVDPSATELILIPGMSITIPSAGNWLATFDSCIAPSTITAVDNFTYSIFVNGIEQPISRRRINSIKTANTKRFSPFYTSTSIFKTAGPCTLEARGAMQNTPTNVNYLFSRVLTLHRLP